MRFLLDTNIISELTRKHPDRSVSRWFAITLGEIRKGIELKRARSPEAVAPFEAWLRALTLQYGSRILPFDAAAADRWGRIMAAHPQVPVEDGQLAATALRHGMTLVTRNERHAVPTGVRLLNPF